MTTLKNFNAKNTAKKKKNNFIWWEINLFQFLLYSSACQFYLNQFVWQTKLYINPFYVSFLHFYISYFFIQLTYNLYKLNCRYMFIWIVYVRMNACVVTTIVNAIFIVEFMSLDWFFFKQFTTRLVQNPSKFLKNYENFCKIGETTYINKGWF